LKEENAKLLKQLDIAQKKLHDFEEYHKTATAEKSKTQALVQKNQELEAKIQDLQSQVQSLQVTSTNSSQVDESDSSALQVQLEQQKRKNEELRDTNYKLLEAVQAQEITTKKLLSGIESKYEVALKDVVSTTTKNFKQILPKQTQLPSVNGSCTIENFNVWLQKLSEVFKQNPVPISSSTPTTQPTQNEDEIESLKKVTAHYKSSLEQVKKQLNLVERVAEEVDKEQKARIAQLENSLESTKRNT